MRTAVQVSGLNAGAGDAWLGSSGRGLSPGPAAAVAAPAGPPPCCGALPARVADSSTPCAASPVDSILDKDRYTLEELLDEDELIQECKSLNARLNSYLKEKETVEKLVRATRA